MSFDPTSITPETLNDAVTAICASLDLTEVNAILTNGAVSFHHGAGTAIRNAWLWNKHHPLHQFFVKTYGLGHADDMSGMILTAVEKKLKHEPYNPEGDAEHYRQYWHFQHINPLTLEPYATSAPKKKLSFLRWIWTVLED